MTSSCYNLISSRCWTAARHALQKNPEQAREWIIATPDEDSGVVGVQKESKPSQVTSRILPLHAACALQPPMHMITTLLDLYPAAAGLTDHQGFLPLHYASGNLASVEVMQMLLQAYPAAVQIADEVSGMLPLHHCVYWGVASLAVLDVMLDYCGEDQQLVLEWRDDEGNTLLDLAEASEWNKVHREAIVEMLKKKCDVRPSRSDSQASSTRKCRLSSDWRKDKMELSPVSVLQTIDATTVKNRGGAENRHHKEVDKLRHKLHVMAGVSATYKEEKESWQLKATELEKELLECKEQWVKEKELLKKKALAFQGLSKEVSHFVEGL